MFAAQLFYKGHVQGVGFRYSVKQIASGFEVSGYVKNLADGRVECWLQGEKSEVEAMTQEIKNSHLNGFIREVQEQEMPVNTELKGFQILA